MPDFDRTAEVAKSEECRTKALDCLELARLIRNPERRRLLEDLARQWLALAEQIDQDEKRR